jgi:hypothetical protein
VTQLCYCHNNYRRDKPAGSSGMKVFNRPNIFAIFSADMGLAMTSDAPFVRNS